MTNSWGIYIALLVLANVIGVVWLLFVTARRRPQEHDEDTTGHIWDEDIKEYNKALPRWWLGMFVLSVIFGAAYLVFYPGFGTVTGTLGWTSANELQADLAENNRKLETVFVRFRDKPLDELAHDPQALILGRNVFVNNCAACHGSDARGARGYPNLTDADWLYGSTAEQILSTVNNGRSGVMPALGAALGEPGVNEAANYVLSLSGGKADTALAETGKIRFMTICAACHGGDGKGNTAIGAPNLTDNVWLYGSTLEDIKTSIREGRNGKMPAWEPIIGKDRVRLVAAWVRAQSTHDEPVEHKP